MDPNNQQQPAQQPGWGAPPPPPQQPAWGTPPPAPQQPGWGAPPPAQPAWGAPPPVQTGGGRSRRILKIVGVVVVILVVGFIALALFGGGSGKVYFSKTTYDSSKSSCSFDSPITTASPSDDIFILADLKDTVPANGSATMEVFKDGVSQGTQPISQGTEYNCYYIKTSIGPLDAGTWKIVITYNGKTEAEGSITVK